MTRKNSVDKISELVTYRNWYEATPAKRRLASKAIGVDNICADKRTEFELFLNDPNNNFQFLYHALRCEVCREITRKLVASIE